MDAASADRVFKAYRTGLLRKPDADAKQGLSYPVLLSLVVRDRFPLRQRAILRRIERASWQGLCAAREGDLEKAKAVLQAGESEVNRAGIAPECRLLGSSILQAALAYLDYREGKLEQARSRIYASMDADCALGNDPAFWVLELHRIQTAHNLMRIDLRAGLPQKALALAGGIFAYLEGRAEGLPVHGGWRKKAIQQAPRIPRRMMIAQVANEAALSLSEPDNRGCWRDLQEKVLPWLATCRPGVHPGVLRWLALKQAFETQDWASYLPLLCEYLPAGREDVSAVWYSCVIEFLEYCQRQDAPRTRLIADTILKDTLKWPVVPPVLRSCLNRYV